MMQTEYLLKYYNVMINKDFILRFEGPFGLTKNKWPVLFEHPFAKESGLYLWAVPYIQGGYLVTYVGETGKTFGRRMKDHFIQTVGGNYRICDPDLLVKGETKVLWNGLWRKGTRDKLSEYLEKLEELAPIIQKGLQTEIVFLALIKSDRRLRQRIEGAIAGHIKSQAPPILSVLPQDVRYYQRSADEEAVNVFIECSCNIHGLPRELVA